MMSAQMNNCRHGGFQSWESQTSETLAFHGEKFFTNTHFVLSLISLRFASLSLSDCIPTAVGWLECWLWTPRWKRSFWVRIGPSASPHSLGCQRPRTAGPLTTVLLNCSIDHYVHYVCKGTTVCMVRASGSGMGTTGVTSYHCYIEWNYRFLFG